VSVAPAHHCRYDVRGRRAGGRGARPDPIRHPDDEVRLIRLATGVAVNALVFLIVARLLPTAVLLQAGRSAPRLGVILLVAGIGAAAAIWLARRVAVGGSRTEAFRRFGVAFVGEVAVLIGLMAVAPAVGVRFGVGGLPSVLSLSSLAAVALLAVLLASAAVAVDILLRGLADRPARWVANGWGSARALNPTRTAIFGIFILSGAAGLMYEVVWARQLVLVFGNTTQAVSAILTGYFGGLAIGSVVGGRLADRVRRPLRLYGVLELVLVFVVLLTPLLFRGLHELYRAGYAGLENQPTALALLRYGLALLALAPATVLMGATLPTLSRHLSRRRAELGSAFGRLYAFNTIGAIVGTLAAGLILIELLGLTGTLFVGAIGSATAGVVAVLIDRRDRDSPRSHDDSGTVAVELPPQTASAVSASTARTGWSGPSLPLVIAFVSGLTSLGYQLLWTRLLASGSGNTTYVFTSILAVFLIGIAVGAAVIARRLGTPERGARNPSFGRLGAIQVVIAAIVLADLLVLSGQVSGLPFLVRVLIVVLPATLAIGLTLPLASSLVAGGDEGIGRDAGMLLGANTLGAIGGTFVVPFFLIPAIGSPASLVVLALINLALGLALVAHGADLAAVSRRVATAAGTAIAVAAGIALFLPNPLVADPGATRLERESVLLADAEDEIAAVQAGGPPGERRLLVGGTGMTRLTVDAKVMTYLPLITRPEASRLLVIAFGMGSSYRSGLIAGLEVDGVELVPSVREMFPYFYPDAPQVLADPNGQLIITDGRNYVELSDRTYDMIVVDPPPPIESSGTSVLYSREFYEASAERLTDSGVMMEWMPYGQSVDEFRSHVRTYASVFPHVMLAFGPTKRGVYMLGSRAPLSVDGANVRAILERPGVLQDLLDTPDNPVATEADWAAILEGIEWLDDDRARAFGDDAALIVDDRPATEYFLLRRLFGPKSPAMNERNLRAATPPG
jgi:spermidine synthase